MLCSFSQVLPTSALRRLSSGDVLPKKHRSSPAFAAGLLRCNANIIHFSPKSKSSDFALTFRETPAQGVAETGRRDAGGARCGASARWRGVRPVRLLLSGRDVPRSSVAAIQMCRREVVRVEAVGAGSHRAGSDWGGSGRERERSGWKLSGRQRSYAVMMSTKSLGRRMFSTSRASRNRGAIVSSRNPAMPQPILVTRKVRCAWRRAKSINSST